MVRPGVNVQSRASRPARGLPTDTGVAFVLGLADEGPASSPVLIQNMSDFVRVFGPRVSYSILYDSMETYFSERGGQAYVMRVVGPAATLATKTLVDRAGAPLSTLRVDALGPGTYGATISVAVVAGNGANQYKIQIWRGGVNVETSPDLNNPTDAVAWGALSGYIRITDLASATAAPNNNPAILATTPLVGGADDRASITDAIKVALLANFPKGLGPGQVMVPGATTSTVHAGLAAHARATNRQALIDLPDTPTTATLSALTAGLNEEYRASFGPWLTIPGLVPNTIRTVPPSTFVAALMSRVDAAMTPNDPAAGTNGQAEWVLGVTQSWDAATRETLNGQGINIVRQVGPYVRLYGYRTNADPVANPGWVALNNQRLRMAITARAEALGENYVFDQIDGQQHKFSEFGGALSGMLLGYYNAGALYGATPGDAYIVDTGPQINTPLTVGDQQLRAVITAKMSPMAEMVTIEIVKVPVTASV